MRQNEYLAKALKDEHGVRVDLVDGIVASNVSVTSAHDPVDGLPSHVEVVRLIEGVDHDVGVGQRVLVEDLHTTTHISAPCKPLQV